MPDHGVEIEMKPVPPVPRAEQINESADIHETISQLETQPATKQPNSNPFNRYVENTDFEPKSRASAHDPQPPEEPRLRQFSAVHGDTELNERFRTHSVSPPPFTNSGAVPEPNAAPPPNDVLVEAEDWKESDTEIPDSGWRAWLVVLGAFCANVTTVGFVNSSGTIQEYLMSHSLADKSESTVGWIFSIYIFLMFFCGIQTGPLVDTFGIKPVLLPGCVLWCASLLITSVCKQYYQFILAFSILGGISSSLIYNPSYTVISQWFTSKRAVALGFVAVGGSVAGSFLPIVLSSLFEKSGYGWTIRILSFMYIGLSVIACLTMQSRNKSATNVKWKDVSIDVRSLRSPTFSWCVLGLLLAEWAYFLPSLYIVDYAKTLGFTSKDSNLLLVYLNIGSTVGRIGSGYVGRHYGVFNSQIVVTLCTGLVSLCVWLPAGQSRPGLTAFAVIFGFFSGAGMSLGPTCVATISNSTNFGRRYGTTYCLISLAVLTSLPIGGVLTKNNYLGMKIATGIVYLASSGATAVARIHHAGFSPFA